MKSLPMLIISLFLLALPVEAQPNRFSSTQGFSFAYPEGWVVLTKEQQHVLVNEYKTVLGKLGDVNFDAMAVIVFNPQNEEFPENINVIVAPGMVPVNEDSKQKHTQTMSEGMRNAGITVTDTVSEITKFGDREALSLRMTLNYPSLSRPIRQWQVALPGRNQTYIITASAGAASFQTYEGAFKRALESFEVDGGSFWFWHSLPAVAQYAIGGAVIGLVISLLGTLFKKIAGGNGNNQ